MAMLNNQRVYFNMLLCLKMGQCRNLQLHPVLIMTNQKKSGNVTSGMVLMGSAQPFRWSNSVGSKGCAKPVSWILDLLLICWIPGLTHL